MDLTFVFPCLNEENTLGDCVRAVRNVLDCAASGLEYEIVVADNGSSDRSVEIAREMGARVIKVDQRGYGAALNGGIKEAAGRYVMFADADATYCYEDALDLYERAVKQGADMAIASRMTGNIEGGAMPFLHRHLGTPVLTALINRLFGGHLSDCNSGFRCILKAAYDRWNIRSTGMEFASELLIKALKDKAVIVEISSGLRCGPADRLAHLRTWRDGMRHLLFIISERPQIFEFSGLMLAVMSTLLQILAFIVGPVNILGLNIFDLHSKIILLLSGLAGVQFYVFSCVLYVKGGGSARRVTRKVIDLDEGALFFLLIISLFVQAMVVAVIFVMWMWSGFGGLDMLNSLVLAGHLLSGLGVLAIGLLGVHVLKRI